MQNSQSLFYYSDYSEYVNAKYGNSADKPDERMELDSRIQGQSPFLYADTQRIANYSENLDRSECDSPVSSVSSTKSIDNEVRKRCLTPSPQTQNNSTRSYQISKIHSAHHHSQLRPARVSRNFKKELCDNIKKYGKCQFDEKCLFWHPNEVVQWRGNCVEVRIPHPRENRLVTIRKGYSD